MARALQLEEEGNGAGDGAMNANAAMARALQLEEEGNGAGAGAGVDAEMRAAMRAPPFMLARAQPVADVNPEILALELRIRQLEGQRLAREQRVNERPAPPVPGGFVVLARLADDVREAVPLEMIRYVAGDGFVEEALVERIRKAKYLKGTAIVPFGNGNGVPVPDDPLVRQIVKQDLVKNNGKTLQKYRDLVQEEGECPICLENRPLFKLHSQHVGNGACQICILDNLDIKIGNLEGVDGPADVKLPQPRAGLPEVAAEGADPNARICGLEDERCNRATSWYDLYKISCTNPLVDGQVNSCERFKVSYRRFLEILNRKIERQREVANEGFQRRAREDRNVNVGALDREIQQLRAQVQEIRDREAAARNARRQQLIAEHRRALEVYRGERGEYNRRAAQRRGIERGNFTKYGMNALKSRWPAGQVHPRSICPWCLEPCELGGGCLTIMNHRCRFPVEELEQQFIKVNNNAFFCALCGRPEGGVGGHQHYTPDGRGLQHAAVNMMQYYDPDRIRALGCGGRGEFVARMITMKNVIQRHVNRGVFDMTQDVRREAALAMRDAAIAYNRNMPVQGIAVNEIIRMLEDAGRNGRFDFLVVDMPEIGPEPQPPQRPRELNQLAAVAPPAALAAPAAVVAAEADRDREVAQNAAQQLVAANRPIPGLLGLGLYLGNIFIEWGGHAFDHCVPRFLRRRGGTRRNKRVARKHTRKGRKGRKTRKVRHS